MKYYLFVCADNIKDWLVGTTIIGIIAIIISLVIIGIVWGGCYNKDEVVNLKKNFFRIVWIGFPVMFILSIVANIMPTTKQLAAIYLLPKIMENKKVTDLPDKALTLANEWLEELSPAKDKSK